MIPRWPVQQYVGQLENPPCTLELWWAADTCAASRWYEDAGEGTAYRQGASLLHRFAYSATARSMRLTHSTEGELPPPRESVALCLHSLPADARPHLLVDGREHPAEHQERTLRADLPAHFRELTLNL